MRGFVQSNAPQAQILQAGEYKHFPCVAVETKFLRAVHTSFNQLLSLDKGLEQSHGLAIL